MWDKVKNFFKNWKTSVPGLLALACASDEYLSYLPEQWKGKALATCMFLVGVGLIAAKDADKSNAPVPAAASKTVG